MTWFDQCFEKLIGHEGVLGRWLFPRFPSQYFIDMPNGHAEQNSKFFLSESAGRPKQPDCINHIISIEAQIAIFAMLLIKFCKSCMPIVFGIRRPLKIFCGVIVFVAVFVIDRSCAIWLFTQKSLGNDGVNASNASVSQMNGGVSLLCHWAKYSFIPNKSSSIFIGYSVSQFFDSSKRRNFKRWFAFYQ
jgi:hypothetical protein